MSDQIELRHLRYFLTVAEELHFRKAAQRLFISQPGLSRQVKQLEEAIDVQLFERNNRNVKLTVAGAYLKAEVSKNLKNLEHILSHARLLDEGKHGALKFGYVGSAMQEVIPNLLLTFRQAHPAVQFGLKEMDNNRQLESLLNQDIDIGFVRLERVPRGLEIFAVLKEPFSVVLPKAHPIDAQTFTDLSQFKSDAFILFDPSYSPLYYEKVMQLFDDSGFIPQVSHNTIHAASIFKLVENNFGLSIVPKSLRDLNNSNIKFIDLDAIAQRTTLSAVWNPQNRNPVLPFLLAILKEELVREH